MDEQKQEREDAPHTPREREEPRDHQPWRSLLALAAGIVLLVALALLMIWVGTLLT